MCNDLRKLRRELVQQGWELEVGGSHYKAYHPKGGFIVMGITPSCHHALHNIKADIKRLNRQHEDGTWISPHKRHLKNGTTGKAE